MSDLPSHGNFSWVEPYLESPWVKLISDFAPQFPPPDASETGEQWRRFAAACSGGAGVVALIGVLAALSVLLRSCCCYSRRPVRRPSAQPVMCVSVLTLLLILAGIASYLLVGHKGVRTALHQMDRAIVDVDDVARQGTELASFGAQLSTTYDATMPRCPQAARAQLAGIRSQIEEYRAAVDRSNEDIKDVPEKMKDARRSMQALSQAVLYGLGAPLVLVMLCCSSIFLVVCVTRGTRGAGHCSNCCVRSLGALLFTPAILVVASLSASEFGLGVAMGSFCRNADTNALTYIRHFEGKALYDISRYYISGRGSNPLVDKMQEANTSMAELHQLLHTYEPIISDSCKAPTAVANMTSVLESAVTRLNALDRLLSPQNIYPYYETSVHQNACKTLISGIGWLVVFQFVAGLVLLPMLTCMADTFFGKWVAWNSQEMARALNRHTWQMGHGMELSV